MKDFIQISIISLILLSCSQTEITSPIEYQRSFSGERKILTKYLDSILVHKMESMITNNNFDYSIQMYQTSGPFKPKIDQLLSLQFNLSDSIIYTHFYTSSFFQKGKNITPHFSKNIHWSTEYYKPTDTILKYLNHTDFWMQPNEIPIQGNDGYYILLEIAKKGIQPHYVLRWVPDYKGLKDKYPKQKEFLHFYESIRKLAVGHFTKSYWEK